MSGGRAASLQQYGCLILRDNVITLTEHQLSLMSGAMCDMDGVKVLSGPFWQSLHHPRDTSLQVQSDSKSGWYLWILQEKAWINSLPKWERRNSSGSFFLLYIYAYWSVFSFSLPPFLYPSIHLFLSFLFAPLFMASLYLYFSFLVRCLLKSIKTTETSVWVKMLIGLFNSSGVFWVQLIVDQRHTE